jgi:peptide-methionine (S)-S-oxide reductase
MNIRQALLAVTTLVTLSLMTEAAPSKPDGSTAVAVLGGGCFWCVEAVYERLSGVQAVESGYAAGKRPNPTYDEVSSGTSGHAEVVRITFDPAKISYRRLIDLFWDAHDPTTLNRQGADTGTQYRSIIIAQDEAQLKEATASRDAAQAKIKAPIVTEIIGATPFYPAEGYHQDYYQKVGDKNSYNSYVITPKLKKLEKQGLIPPAPPQP